MTRILVDVLAGTVGVLLELRRTDLLPADVAMLRVTAVAQQAWICTAAVNEFTAWSITRVAVRHGAGEFQLNAQCLPAGALRIVGASAEFLLLESVALAQTPPDHHADARELVHFGVATEDTECRVVGVARSTPVEEV